MFFLSVKSILSPILNKNSRSATVASKILLRVFRTLHSNLKSRDLTHDFYINWKKGCRELEINKKQIKDIMEEILRDSLWPSCLICINNTYNGVYFSII